MATLPQLLSKDPVVVPAQEEQVITQVVPASEEKVYDKYWMRNMVVIAPDPQNEARLVATLVPARDVETIVNGETVIVKELMPDENVKTIIVNNVFERASTDMVFAQALGMVLNSIITLGKEQGIIQ